MSSKQPERLRDFEDVEAVEKYLAQKLSSVGTGWEFERWMLHFLAKDGLIKEYHRMVRDETRAAMAKSALISKLVSVDEPWPVAKKTKHGDIYLMLKRAGLDELRLPLGSYEPVFRGERIDINREKNVLQNYVYSRCGETLEPGPMADLVFGIAEENTFDPLTEYVKSCKDVNYTRGGIETSLIKFWDIPDTPLARETCRLFWMGLVARWTRPGCRFEYLVTLYSATEGHQKTAFLRSLAPPGSGAYLSLGGVDFDSKDVQMKLSGAGIIELAEGQAFRRNEVDAQKRWITETFDRFRAPYGRMHDIKTHHRRFVPVLTTNHRTVLQDNTGNRRHLFLELRAKPSTKDLEEFMKLVPSFVAEAYARVEAGEPLYIENAALVAQQNDSNSGMTPIDVVERAIEEFFSTEGCNKYFAFSALKRFATDGMRDYDQKLMTDKALSSKLTDLGFIRRFVNPYQLMDTHHRTIYEAPSSCPRLGIEEFEDNSIDPLLRVERRKHTKNKEIGFGPS